MGVASKMNKGGKFKFKFDEANKDKIVYINPEDLFKRDPEGKKPYIIKLMYINKKGKYGDAGAFANETEILNCPKHMTDDVKSWMNDDEIVAQCDEGKLGAIAYKYDTANDARGYSFGLRFVDL